MVLFFTMAEPGRWQMVIAEMTKVWSYEILCVSALEAKLLRLGTIQIHVYFTLSGMQNLIKSKNMH